MKSPIIACLVAVCITIGLSVQPASANAQTDGCECVGYVVNTLFNGPRGKGPNGETWDYAKDMATDAYWNNAQIKSEGKARVRSRTAAPGDVIIMQPDARIEAFNPNTKQWESVGNNIGKGAGHIGFVMGANYFKEGYWEILMRSANWDARYNILNNKITENKCPNVTLSKIRVYNGPKTSYWRPV